MKPSMRRLVRVLQLRRLRAHQAEQGLRRSLEALEGGRAEHEKALAIEAAWQRSGSDLDAWLSAAEPGQRVRWSAIAEARRIDVLRSIREAHDYAIWCNGELDQLRQASDRARVAWRREQSRLDALERRRDAERRTAADLEEERTFQERADASATSSAPVGLR